MIKEYPLDIWHGDDCSFLPEIFRMLPGMSPGMLLDSTRLKNKHDHEFALILINPNTGVTHRLFPRFDPLHSIISLISALRHKAVMGDNVGRKVISRLLLSLPKKNREIPIINSILKDIESKLDIKGSDLANIDASAVVLDSKLPDSLLSAINKDEEKKYTSYPEHNSLKEEIVEALDNTLLDDVPDSKRLEKEIKAEELKEKVENADTKDLKDVRKSMLSDCEMPVDKKLSIVLNDEDEVKEACSYFNTENLDDLDPVAMLGAYKVLTTKIAELNISGELLPDFNFSDNAEHEIEKRIKIARVKDKPAYTGFLKSFRKMSALQASAMLSVLDYETKLARFWGKDIKKPLSSLTERIKVAGYSYSDPNSGYSIAEQDLFDMASDLSSLKSIASYFGDDAADEFKVAPVEFFKHLPDPHKVIIMKIYKGELELDDDDDDLDDDDFSSVSDIVTTSTTDELGSNVFDGK